MRAVAQNSVKSGLSFAPRDPGGTGPPGGRAPEE